MDPIRIAPVAGGEWEVVRHLFQLFRHDVAPFTGSWPEADGRYLDSRLDGFPGPGHHGYLAWRRGPAGAPRRPAGLALIRPGDGGRRNLTVFWIAPGARRTGLGRRLAHHVLGEPGGGWDIAFQPANTAAAALWRRTAAEVWGTAWEERAGTPPDHWIHSRPPQIDQRAV